MFAMIGNILKVSGFVVLVLVLSHIIQVRGVSISQHVENAMGWFAGTPRQVTRVTQEFSSGVAHQVGRAIQLRSADPSKKQEIEIEDQKALNRIIERNQRR